jgi:hypothetical protein
VKELSFKLLPRVNQAMTGEDGLKARGLQRAGLDELEKARFVLGAPGLERDGGEVFRRKDTRQCPLHVFADRFPQRFSTNEVPGGRNRTGQPPMMMYSPSIPQPRALR